MALSTAQLVDAARALHDRLRRSVAMALRDRVAGEDNAARADLIWGKPDQHLSRHHDVRHDRGR
jgi:hypothetical protein